MYLNIPLYKLRSLAAILVAALLFSLCAVLLPKNRAPVMNETAEITLVIDPGHGGIDGGAISVNGDKESELNLAIALKIDALAALFGQRCFLTRDSDESFTAYPDYSEREELKHRVRLINAQSGAVLLSIHQNCFPDARVSGSQILYAATDGSSELAKVMQDLFLTHIDPDNRRVAAPAPAKLYVTANVQCPALLMECGFLSNAHDTALLCDGNYQTKLAAVMLAAFFQYRYKDNVV